MERLYGFPRDIYVISPIIVSGILSLKASDTYTGASLDFRHAGSSCLSSLQGQKVKIEKFVLAVMILVIPAAAIVQKSYPPMEATGIVITSAGSSSIETFVIFAIIQALMLRENTVPNGCFRRMLDATVVDLTVVVVDTLESNFE